MLQLDHSLLHRAEIINGGSNPHTRHNMVAAYKMAYQYYLDSPDESSEELVKKTEKDLRRYLNRFRNR